MIKTQQVNGIFYNIIAQGDANPTHGTRMKIATRPDTGDQLYKLVPIYSTLTENVSYMAVRTTLDALQREVGCYSQLFNTPKKRLSPATTLQKAIVRTLNKIPTVYATRRLCSGGQGHLAFQNKLHHAAHAGQAFQLHINKMNPDLPKFQAIVDAFNKRQMRDSMKCKVAFIAEPA